MGTSFSTSASLLQRVRQTTDREAWERFVQLYTPLLFWWLRRAGLQQEDAADLVQDVLTDLVRKLPSFEYKLNGSFRGWLRMVVLNKWRDRRKRRASLEVTAGSALLDQAEPDPLPELTEAEYRQQLVSRALKIMQSDFEPTTWRACWELIEGERPAAEIAAELGLTAGAVYAAKFRILARLRQELAGLIE